MLLNKAMYTCVLIAVSVFCELSLAGGFFEDLLDVPRRLGNATGDVISFGETGRQREREYEERKEAERKAALEASQRETQAKKEGLARTIAEQQLAIEGWERVKSQLPAMMLYYELLLDTAQKQLGVAEKLEQDGLTLEKLRTFQEQTRQYVCFSDAAPVLIGEGASAERVYRSKCQPARRTVDESAESLRLKEITGSLRLKLEQLPEGQEPSIEQAVSLQNVWADTLSEYDDIFADSEEHVFDRLFQNVSALALDEFIKTLSQLKIRLDNLESSIEQELEAVKSRKTNTEAELQALG